MRVTARLKPRFKQGVTASVNGKPTGFTLAELLVAVTILGVIATFTIPKVMQSQQSSSYKAIGKETAGAIVAAYATYQANNNAVSASFQSSFLTPYLNYVKFDTASTIDDGQTATNLACNNSHPCVRLHSGAILRLENSTFNNTAATNFEYFEVDPDGKVTNGGTGDTSAGAPGKSIYFALYTDGNIATLGTLRPNSYCGYGAQTANPAYDPPWFGWN